MAILQGDWRCPNASGATTCSDASRSVSYSVILEERIPHHVFPKRLYGRRYANNLAYRFNVLIKDVTLKFQTLVVMSLAEDHGTEATGA